MNERAGGENASALAGDSAIYIFGYMKQILIEIDDRCARDLARVAPTGNRVRAEFIRMALRRAIDLALDRDTEAAYRKQPAADDAAPADLLGWDANNELAEPAVSTRKTRSRRSARKSAA